MIALWLYAHFVPLGANLGNGLIGTVAVMRGFIAKVNNSSTLAQQIAQQ